jgi:hypothetical protein
MLRIEIHNDGTGDAFTANYTYRVMVNARVIASGKIKGHKRGEGWLELARKVNADAARQQWREAARVLNELET